MAERQARTGRRSHDGNGGREAFDTRLLDVATRLFAELGYDGVSIRMIADSVGVDPGTLADRYGGKSGLYVAVIERAVQRWSDRLKSTAEEYTQDADGLIMVMDRYLDYCLEHPEVPKLWIHRWMADASDLTGLDERLGPPLLKESIGFIRPVVGPDVDPEAALWTLVWAIHGYMQAGFLDASGRRRPPDDPQTLRRLRGHLHWLIRKMAAQD